MANTSASKASLLVPGWKRRPVHPPGDSPWQYSHPRSQIQWQNWYKLKQFSLPSPCEPPSHLLSNSPHSQQLSLVKLAAFYLLGHPNWHCLDLGSCPRCEEKIETIGHALLRCPARQYARGPFPKNLGLKSAYCN